MPEFAGTAEYYERYRARYPESMLADLRRPPRSQLAQSFGATIVR